MGIVSHTPGPWTAEIERHFRQGLLTDAIGVRGPGGTFVAAAFDFNRDDREAEVEANARLIAAAPEMLAALEAYQRWSDASERAALSTPNDHQRRLIDEAEAADEFHRLTDAAIAKAQGSAS